MMTKEQLIQYKTSNSLFEDTCKRIAEEMERVDPDWKFIRQFQYYDDEIECDGEEHWAYGGYEHYTKWFPTSLLTSSEEELKKYVDELVAEKEREEEKERKAKEAIDYKRELAEYERLKKKFGN